jgi:hypothetical protein
MRQRLRNVKGLTWNKGIHAAFYDPGSDFVVQPQHKSKMLLNKPPVSPKCLKNTCPSE